MKKAAETYLKGVLEYTEDEVVSSDFIHSTASSVFDGGSGIELNSRFFKLVAWYDNEWRYGSRCIGLLKKVACRPLTTSRSRTPNGVRVYTHGRRSVSVSRRRNPARRRL